MNVNPHFIMFSFVCVLWLIALAVFAPTSIFFIALALYTAYVIWALM